MMNRNATRDVLQEQHSTDGRESRSLILVVDDESIVADTLSAILRNAGYSTLTAYDGSTALAAAKSSSPDLLISDVAMPNMNGVELATAVSRTVPGCRVLLFSGNATSSDILHIYGSGEEWMLLPKPIHPTRMLKHVQDALEEKQRVVRTRTVRTEVVPRESVPELA